MQPQRYEMPTCGRIRLDGVQIDFSPRGVFVDRDFPGHGLVLICDGRAGDPEADDYLRQVKEAFSQPLYQHPTLFDWFSTQPFE